MSISNINAVVSGPGAVATCQYKTVTLKPNVINGVNILNQEMLSQANTKYIIKYDYTLAGDSITIPANCVLQFDGGSLSNGAIIGVNTVIEAELVKIFSIDITLSGTWNVAEAYPEWFGAKVGSQKQELYINKCIEYFDNTFLLDGIYYIDSPIIITSYKGLFGKGIGKTGINKTTHTTASGIPLTTNNVNLNADAIIIIKPLAIDPAGENQFNRVKIEDIEIHGISNDIGIFMSNGRRCELTNIVIYKCLKGIRTEFSWGINFNNITITDHYVGEDRQENSIGFAINLLSIYSGMTLLCFRNCYANGCYYGYKIKGASYGLLDNCACDGSYITSYWFDSCIGFSINSCGSENQTFTEDSDSATYYFSYSIATLISCHTDGNNEVSGNWIHAYNNSEIQVIGYFYPSNYTIKASGYSSIRILGNRNTIDSSLLDCASNSNILVLTGRGVKVAGDSPATFSFEKVVTETKLQDDNNFVGSLTKNGTVPAGFLPSNSLPSGISDADNLKQGVYFVSGASALAHLPSGIGYGVICTISIPSGNGVQYYFDCSNNNILFRIKSSSWSGWRQVTINFLDTNGAAPKKYGIGSEKPSLTQANTGFMYFINASPKRPIFWDGTDWRYSDGSKYDTLRSGTKAQRPSGSSIYIGFQYMQVDTTNGTYPIWASAINGDTVTWVDATGATI